MPRVHAVIGPKLLGQGDLEIFRICEQVIPAGLTSQAGPLEVGDILFTHQHVQFGLEGRYDVLIDVEAHPFKDRLENAKERIDAIQMALELALPSLTPLVYVKFIEGHWGGPAGEVKNPLTFDPQMKQAIRACLDKPGSHWIPGLEGQMEPHL